MINMTPFQYLLLFLAIAIVLKIGKKTNPFTGVKTPITFIGYFSWFWLFVTTFALWGGLMFVRYGVDYLPDPAKVGKFIDQVVNFF